MKKIVLLPEKIPSTLMLSLVDSFGTPTIYERMSMYGSISNKIKIQMLFKDKKLFCKIGKTSEEKSFIIENKNLKSFLKSTSLLCNNKSNIGIIREICFSFYGGSIKYLEDSFAGNFLDVELYDNHLCFEQNRIELEKVLSIYDLDLSDRSCLVSHIKPDEYPHKIFDDFGVLNPVIVGFCKNSGFDVMADSESLQSRLEGVSNNYTHLEIILKKYFNINLLSTHSIDKDFEFKPVSIIISSFNSEYELPFVLYSIQSQNLSQDDIKKIQVIIVDDGSNVPVRKILEDISYNFSFEIKIIRLEQNMDVSYARNIGYQSCKYEIVLFIDADILLAKNYLYEHNIRTQFFPNALFVSFRKNIERGDLLLNKQKILKGLEVPKEFDDSRILNIAHSAQIGWNKHCLQKRKLELLSDTNYFKNLGNGMHVGIYDLPGIVSGHNISMRGDIFNCVHGFDTRFKGWGFEDKFFAAKVISMGNFIIPVISTGVYHIGYGPRGGDLDRKIYEANNNYELYEKLIQEQWKTD